MNSSTENKNVIFEQTQKLTHQRAVLDEQTIRYVFKPAPRFIPEIWWYKFIAKLIVREVHRKW